MDDLCAALAAVQMPLDDIIDSVEPFEKADEAIEYIWQGKQIGKLVLQIRSDSDKGKCVNKSIFHDRTVGEDMDRCSNCCFYRVNTVQYQQSHGKSLNPNPPFSI